MPQENRKLAAVLFADIVGYTGLMQKDEVLAKAQLNKFREALKKQVPHFNGNIVNFYGDGCLAIFNSPLESAQCATILQQEFQQSPIVPVRVGLHSGSVVVDGENVFGDAVNLTSRIESMGVAGAVLFSERIRNELKNQRSFSSIPLGDFTFKNVDEPMALYALEADGLVVPKASELKGKTQEVPDKATPKNTNYFKWAILAAVFLLGVFGMMTFVKYQNDNNTSTFSESEKNKEKTIAILPFRDLSPGGDQVYFADGIVEAIRSKLAQVANLQVTSMTSVLGYRDNPKSIAEIAGELKVAHILEGTIYRDKDKVRIIAQLIDPRTDKHLWAQTYDEEITDIFEIQTRIANQVTKELKAQLTPEEKVKLSSSFSTNINAYDMVLSAQAAWNDYQKQNDTTYFNIAFQKYQQALEMDPELDKACVGLSRCWYQKYWIGSGEEATLDSATAYAVKAIQLNPYNDNAYVAKAYVDWRKREFDESKKAAEKALDLAPNSTGALILLARYYSNIEQSPEKELPLLLKAITLDPQNQATPDGNLAVFLNIANIYHNADLNLEAEKLYRKALSLYPNASGSYGGMAWVTFTQGKYEESLKYRKQRMEMEGGEKARLRVIDALAVQLFYDGQYEEAEKYYRILQSRIDSGFVENPHQHIYRHRLAAILLETEREKEGKTLMDEHIQLCLDQIKDGTVYNGQEYDLAGAYAYLGDKEKAYEWLEKVKYQHFIHKFMRLDPFFDSLREEDRFKRILAKGEEQVRRYRNTLKSMEVDGKLLLTAEDK